MEAPKEIPDGKLEEKEPTGDGAGGGDPYAFSDNKRARPRRVKKVAKVEKSKKKKRKKKKKPLRESEVDQHAKPAPANARPAYPSDAKAAGIEGTVILKYIVTERGTVANVRVLRGPESLRNACIAAVRRWRFEPALKNGRPVPVYRMARIPFHIRT